MQESMLAHSTLQDCVFTEPFDDVLTVAMSSDGAYWAVASGHKATSHYLAKHDTLWYALSRLQYKIVNE